MNYKHFYVIPGTEKEFQDYAYKHTDRLEKIGMVPRIVLESHDLSPDVNPNGIFIGTWKDNPQITNILSRLYFLCQDTKKRERINRVIDDCRIYKSW